MRATSLAGKRGAVLVVGVYLTDRETYVAPAIAELAGSRDWSVTQRWLALGNGPIPAGALQETTERRRDPEAKFALINRLIGVSGPLAENFDYVLVCDDDAALPRGFLDDYLHLAKRYRLALAQPARTIGGYNSHAFTVALSGIVARRTRFVEIGPVFSIAREAYPLILPFDESAGMGWGYDFAWPVMIETAGLAMGIIDRIAVTHRRPTAGGYDTGIASDQMHAYLAARPHLSRDEAFKVLEVYQ